MNRAELIEMLARVTALHPGYRWRVAGRDGETISLPTDEPSSLAGALLGRPGGRLEGTSPRGILTLCLKGGRIVLNHTRGNHGPFAPVIYPREIPRAVLRRVLAAGRAPGAIGEARRREIAGARFARLLLDLLPPAEVPAVLECGAGPAPWGLILLAALARTGRQGRLVIIDRSGEALRAAAALAEQLRLPLEAVQAGIEEYQPSAPPDLLLAVHACGTACLSAAALAVAAGAGAVCLAPCCAPPGMAKTEGLWDRRLDDHPAFARRLDALALGLACLERLREGGYLVEDGEADLPPWREAGLIVRAYHPRVFGQNMRGGDSRGQD